MQHRRTKKEKARAKREAFKWAVKFWRDPETQESYDSMEGTQSASAPGTFLRFFEAMEHYVRPATAKLRDFVAGRRKR